MHRKRRQRRRLTVVPERPEGVARVMERTAQGSVLLTGNGAADWYCGGCDALLLVGVEPRQLPDTVLRCAQCAAFNVLPG